MRQFHRILAIIASLFLLYVGVTGTAIQTLDLSAVLGGAQETDATMRSINEGKFGNGDYSVVNDADWDGEVLPNNLDIGKALTTVVAAYHQAEPAHPPEFAELRVAGGRVVGQAGYLGPVKTSKSGWKIAMMEVKAFDAEIGAEVAATSVSGARPPPSPRQTLKEWHRFWGQSVFLWRGDKPGVYIELAVGLAMCTLIGTGLVMYFRLLGQRRKIDRPQLFWIAGSTWRALHRSVSMAASVLLILVALSGTWLGFESSWHTFVARASPEKPVPLSDAQIPQMAEATLSYFRKLEPQAPIRVLRVRYYYGIAQGGVVTDGPPTRQLVFNLGTGRELGLSEPEYPDGGFPVGTDVHEWAKHFHSGYLFGLPARFMSLLAGLSLIWLSLSGIVMYVQMWRARRGGFFWKG